MAYLGDPQDKLKIIHIAGTSGKTSTAYYAAALLIESGFKVGLSVSPHIDSISERAQIDLRGLPEGLYCIELGAFLDLVAQSKLQPTYFEVLVAFAFWLFERQKVGYAVIEVGLGGLLDGTNVVRRSDKIVLITDIGYDHMEILGKTLPEIAAQKAGIIHEGNQVFIHTQGPEVMEVVREKALLENANLELIAISKDLTGMSDFKELPDFQQRNFALAYGALRGIIEQPKAIKKALSVHIPARMEELEWSGKTVILDGSHNEQKIEALVRAMKKKYGDQPIVLVVSFGDNKSARLEGNLALLREISSHIIITKFYLGQDKIRQPIDPSIIVPIAKKLGFLAEFDDDPQIAFGRALKQSESIVLVTGSFYLLNHIRPIVLSAESIK